MGLKSKELIQIREILTDSLPWSPRDFVRELSSAGDRRLFAEQLTTEIQAANDLRLVGQLPSGRKAAAFAEVLTWDTAFFGYGVARLDGVFLLDPPYHQTTEEYTALLRPLLEEARQKRVRYLFATVEPRDLALMRTVGSLGFSLIETRLYYHMALKDFRPAERYPVRAAVHDDIPSLGKAAQVMVNEFDRFHADPFIQKDDADRLMYRWMEASIGEGFADVTIVPDCERPAAFCTVKYHEDKWPIWGLKLAQPVFSAVSPEFRGWYRKIISEINCHLQERGAEHSYLATQVTNKAVVRVWESLGYRLGKGEHIFRLVLEPGA
jgi:dTDP-4-amino-4,6-dideoxy-D-galactose acyltransferase